MFCARDGVDAVARALATKSGPTGPTERWWRCNLLLSTELSAEDALRVCRELLALEASGSGPAFDVDRHALEVSTVIRYLQTHLEGLRTGDATSFEQDTVAWVVRVARMARRHGGAATGN